MLQLLERNTKPARIASPALTPNRLLGAGGICLSGKTNTSSKYVKSCNFNFKFHYLFSLFSLLRYGQKHALTLKATKKMGNFTILNRLLNPNLSVFTVSVACIYFYSNTAVNLKFLPQSLPNEEQNCQVQLCQSSH